MDRLAAELHRITDKRATTRKIYWNSCLKGFEGLGNGNSRVRGAKHAQPKTRTDFVSYVSIKSPDT